MTDEAAQAYEDYLIKQAQEESIRLQVQLFVCVYPSCHIKLAFHLLGGFYYWISNIYFKMNLKKYMLDNAIVFRFLGLWLIGILFRFA